APAVRRVEKDQWRRGRAHDRKLHAREDAGATPRGIRGFAGARYTCARRQRLSDVVGVHSHIGQSSQRERPVDFGAVRDPRLSSRKLNRSAREAMARSAETNRTTKETAVSVRLDLDGTGEASIETGIGFLDHMLELFARHSLFDLALTCKGDLEVDQHHSVEDIALTLGRAFAEAVGDKQGIARFAASYVPMDETLVRTVVDLSGRAFLVYRVPKLRDRIGELDVEMVEHFWRSFAGEVRCNLHVELLYGANQHHVIEAVFKSAARALAGATRISERIAGVLSTKGTL